MMFILGGPYLSGTTIAFIILQSWINDIMVLSIAAAKQFRAEDGML